jgi:hypothetical protein
MPDKYPASPAVKADLVALLTSGTRIHAEIHDATGWGTKLNYAKAVRAIGAEFGYSLQLGDDPDHKRRKTFRFVRP